MAEVWQENSQQKRYQLLLKVIIIEAGERWDGKSSRKRVPQSNHPHVLLKGGENAIEELFPNITNELIEAGSIVNNFTRDLKWHQFGLWKQPFIGKYI